MVFLESSFDVVFFSQLIILVSVIIIVFALAVFFLLTRKKGEEKVASGILNHLDKIKLKESSGQRVFPSERSHVVTKSELTSHGLEIKSGEYSLKQMLIDKFQPVIEKQLKAPVTVKDFNAQNENFVVVVDAGGLNLSLVLDSSGKIIDYKRLN